MSERPGGTKQLDRRVAESIGWREIIELSGMFALVGKPPGSDKVEPVPFYSSTVVLAQRALESFKSLGGEIDGDMPSEPWLICERIVKASERSPISSRPRNLQ